MPENLDPGGPRVLQHVALATMPRSLAPPRPLADPAVQALVDRATAEAYERGLAQGRSQGRHEAEAAATALGEQLADALAVAIDASRSLTDDLASRVATLAVEIAAVVVPSLEADSTGVVRRVEQALRAIDDRPLVIHAHPRDVTALVAASPPEVEVVADDHLAPGEVRITGRWAEADLTWEAMWTAVREVLDAD